MGGDAGKDGEDVAGVAERVAPAEHRILQGRQGDAERVSGVGTGELSARSAGEERRVRAVRRKDWRVDQRGRGWEFRDRPRGGDAVDGGQSGGERRRSVRADAEGGNPEDGAEGDCEGDGDRDDECTHRSHRASHRGHGSCGMGSRRTSGPRRPDSGRHAQARGGSNQK